MSPLACCPSCAGFVPLACAACPHCDAPVAGDAPRRPLAARLARAAAGAACAVTLMACYGAPPRPTGPIEPDGPGCSPTGQDLDLDGSCPPADCNDAEFAVGPHAVDEPGDRVDANCDGVDGVAPAAAPAP